MHELATLVFLYMIDLEDESILLNPSGVRKLSAHLRVKNAAVQHQDGFFPLGNNTAQFAFHNDGKDIGFAFFLLIADEIRFRDLLTEAYAGPAEISKGFAGLSGAFALFLHQGVESLLIDSHALVIAHLHGQIQRESICVVELESISSGEYDLALLFVRVQQF